MGIALRSVTLQTLSLALLIIGCHPAQLSSQIECPTPTAAVQATLQTEGGTSPYSFEFDQTSADAECWAGSMAVIDQDSHDVHRFNALDGNMLEPLVLHNLERQRMFSSITLPMSNRRFVTDFEKGSVLSVDSQTGEYLKRRFEDRNVLEEPVKILAQNDLLYVLGNDTENIVVLDDEGDVITNFKAPEINYPHDMAFGPDGFVYVAVESYEAMPHWVQVWNPQTETFERSYPAPKAGDIAMSVAVSDAGEMFVANYTSSEIIRYPNINNTLNYEVYSLPQKPLSLGIGPSNRVYALTEQSIYYLEVSSSSTETIELVRLQDYGIKQPRSLVLGN